MGTDRTIAYHGPCPCGSAEIEVEFCVPDHPWPTKSKWFESRITCSKCAARYALQEQNNQYGLIDKTEIKKKEKRYEAYKAAQADLLRSQQAKEVIRRFVSLLDNQPSVAATHRLLASHNLIYESYATFLRRWQGPEPWVQGQIGISPHSLAQLAEMLGLEDDYITNAVSELIRLWDECQRPLPFHGAPLFDTSPYRSY